jgi:hypothetical protein
LQRLQAGCHGRRRTLPDLSLHRALVRHPVGLEQRLYDRRTELILAARRRQ